MFKFFRREAGEAKLFRKIADDGGNDVWRIFCGVIPRMCVGVS